MATYGSIEPFNGKKDEWEQYIERIEQFFLANELGEIVPTDNNAAAVTKRQEKRKAILLSLIGPETYSLLRNLVSPDKPADKSFHDITTALQNYYAPKPSSTVQRFKFNTTIRKPGESVAQFLSALRKVAEHCEFTDLQERLKDQFLYGIQNDRMKKRLLQQENLTLQKAYDLALAQEMTENDMTVLSAPETVNKVQSSSSTSRPKFNKSNRNDKQCFRCGDASHLAPKCKHIKTECNFCHVQGHLAKVCFKKKRQESGRYQPQNTPNTRASRTTSTPHTAAYIEESSETEDYTYNVSEISTKIPPIITTLTVDDKLVEFQVDTGSANTLISASTYLSTFNGTLADLQPSKVKLRSYSGDEIHIVGEKTVTVKQNEDVQLLKILIVSNPGPALLGRLWMRALQLHLNDVFSFTSPASLQGLLEDNAVLFDTGTGLLKNYKAHFEVDEAATPTFCKARTVPLAMKKKVEDELQKLESTGIIRKVTHSDWAAAVVPVLKPSGKIRLCGDYKMTVNKVVKIDRYPLPLVDELFAGLEGGKMYTKLDLSQAYHQVELDDESRKYTTINTHSGLYEYQRLPYGVSPAVGIFQRAMENILKGLRGVCVYLDDILVTGRDEEEHLQNLETVLKVLNSNGLKLQKSKCEFFMPQVEYLGFTISAAGISPTSDKVRAIQDSPAPSNVGELRSFTGLVNYYARFQPNLAHYMAPLYNLMRKEVSWKWTAVEEKAFKRIKEKLTTEIILAHYDPDAELVLSCDASPVGVGAVLQQQKDGILRPIYFASRSLSKAEVHYAQIDREALAIVFGVQKFRQFLLGRHFVLITDHQPLTTLFGEKRNIPLMASARIKRWALILSAYTYTVQHVPGKDNSCADYLSRAPLESKELHQDDAPTEVLLLEDPGYKPLSAKVIAAETRKDQLLVRAFEMTQEGWPNSVYEDELRPYHIRRSELTTEQGLLLWGRRVVIPTRLRATLLMDLHTEHDGVVRMKSIARQYFWWPKMDSDIEEVAKKCSSCQETAPMPAKVPTASWNWPTAPWKRLHIDYAGPFLNFMFLVVVDAHSKWLEVYKMNSSTSAATIEKLRLLFATHGLPEHIVSDNGTCFTSAEFKQFLEENNIRHTCTAPGHPASNGLAERYVGYFKNKMNKLKDLNESIDQKTARILLSYRSTPHPATGETPAKLLFGRQLRTRFSAVKPSLLCDQEMYDKNSMCTPRFKAGDSVFALNLRAGPHWLPGIIIDVMQRSYSVQVGQVVWKRHEDQLRARSLQLTERESRDNDSVPRDTANRDFVAPPVLEAPTTPLVPTAGPMLGTDREVLSAPTQETITPLEVNVPQEEFNTPRRNPPRNRRRPSRFRDE